MAIVMVEPEHVEIGRDGKVLAGDVDVLKRDVTGSANKGKKDRDNEQC